MEVHDGFDGWPTAARDLVEAAIARHGGRQRYLDRQRIGLQLDHLGGPLPWMKGIGTSVPAPRRVDVEPRARRTTYLDWPAPGHRGIYHDGGVRILDASGRAVVDSPAHRARVPRLLWRAEDVLYFFGYALVTYMALPFALASTRLVRSDALSVTVDFPPGFDTHCTRQRFHFDDSGLLVRHDYTADVVGPWARGAHYSSGYVDAGGLALATRRRVVGRLAAVPMPVPVLEARIRVA